MRERGKERGDGDSRPDPVWGRADPGRDRFRLEVAEIVVTVEPTMRTALLALVLAGCGLYSDDGTDPGVDAGNARPMSGTYSVSWTCATPPCANPISNTVQAVVTDGSPTTIAWARNGDPTAVVTHLAERNSTGACIVAQAGTDLGVPRDGYYLCFSESSESVLDGAIVWDGTFSDVVLTRQ